MTQDEIRKLLEKQFTLLSEQSDALKDSLEASEIARLSEQMANIAKLLLDL